MELSLAVQLSTLGQSFLLGLMCGVLLEVIRVWKCFKRTPFWQFCQDFIFCVSVSVSALWLFQTRCDGQIRWFHLMMLGLGMWIYHKTLGKILYRPAVLTVKKTGQFFAFVLHWVLYPFAWLGKLLGLIFGKINKFIKNIFRKTFIFLKQYIIINLYSKMQNKIASKKQRRKPKVENPKPQSDRGEDIARFFH